MADREHPIRPLQRSLQSVVRRLSDPRLLVPFLLLALCKVLLLSGMARLDLLPARALAAALAVVPQAGDLLHYPEVLYKLPGLARWLDWVVFLTIGPILHGWAILYLARQWTHAPLVLLPGFWRGAGRIVALILVASLVLAVPLGARYLAHYLEPSIATAVALTAGLLVQVCFFAAPAFLVIEGRSLWESLRLSLSVLADYPIAIPLAILLLAAVHVPTLALRSPAFVSGVGNNPDWILFAVLAQVPVDLLGAMLAAGLAARFALSYRFGRQAV